MIDRITVAILAGEKGANAHKLIVALNQLQRMENTDSTVSSILIGNFSVIGERVTLYDNSDPNRSEFDYLYQRA